MTSLWRPGGKVTFFWAKPLIRFLTTSIPVCQKPTLAFFHPQRELLTSNERLCAPLSSLAFSSRTASLYASPSICRARHRTDVVFPIPGMPEMMTWGIFPSRAMIFNRSTVSVFPTISSRNTGLYFSTLPRRQRECQWFPMPEWWFKEMGRRVHTMVAHNLMETRSYQLLSPSWMLLMTLPLPLLRFVGYEFTRKPSLNWNANTKRKAKRETRLVTNQYITCWRFVSKVVYHESLASTNYINLQLYHRRTRIIDNRIAIQHHAFWSLWGSAIAFPISRVHIRQHSQGLTWLFVMRLFLKAYIVWVERVWVGTCIYSLHFTEATRYTR